MLGRKQVMLLNKTNIVVNAIVPNGNTLLAFNLTTV